MAHGRHRRVGRENNGTDPFRVTRFEGYCDRTGKRRYATKSRAKRDMKLAAKHDVGRHTAAYPCGHCGDWHTTSMPQAPDRCTSND